MIWAHGAARARILFVRALGYPIDRLRERRLADDLLMLVNAIEDVMETPEEAADWARTGDMQGYIDTALATLRDLGYVKEATHA